MEDKPQRDSKGRLLKGHGGLEGAGRPKGVTESKRRINEMFLSDLIDVWEQVGIRSLMEAFEDKPAQMASVVAQLVPKEMTHKVEEDIPALLAAARKRLEEMEKDGEKD